MAAQMTRVRIECDAFVDQEVEIVELEGQEALSRDFDIEVMVAVRTPEPTAPEDIVASLATLVFETNTAERGSSLSSEDREEWYELRRLHGFVCECDDMLLSDDTYITYRLRIVPRFWQTRLLETLDIFMDLSIPDIIRKKLSQIEMSEGEDFRLELSGSYPAREFVVQYKETDHAFICRLCEHHGIFYFFDHSGAQDVIVFADVNAVCQPIAESEEVSFAPRGERRGIYELSSKTRLVPKVFVQRDYNYRNPQADLTAVSENDVGFAGGIIEYGGNFRDDAEGRRLAEIRAQERKCERTVLYGKSDVGSLAAGRTLKVIEHPRGDHHLLLTQVLHHARQSAFSQSLKQDATGYHNELLAIPYSIPYRPPRLSSRPRIGGVLTGIVDGAGDGQYAEIDDQGRYRVKFMFDTSGEGEGKASRVVRMMQPHSGAGYGMHFPLRIGTEVLITFMDGDPDRPIIAGTVPNPLTASPVKADNAKRNVIRTGGGNEIDIDDDDGNQRVKITSPHGSSVVQIGSSNEAENGIALGTMNNVTSAADGSVNALTTVQTSWNSFNDTWSCHITDYAGPTTPLARLQFGIDAFKGVAIMVGDICGGILAVRDAVASEMKMALKLAVSELDEQTGPRDKSRDALLACLGNVDRSGLSDEDKKKLDDLDKAIEGYDDAVAELAKDQKELGELKTEKAELEEAGKDTSAAAVQKKIDAKKKEVEADRKLIKSRKEKLDEKLTAVKTDDDLKDLTCGQKKLGVAAKDFDDKNDDYDDARAKVDDLGQKVEDTESALAGAQETKDWADGLVAVTDSLTAPIFSLVTSIWGTGMQGLARNVSDFMLQEALQQHEGIMPFLVPSPKMSFDIKSPPLFMKLTPPPVEARGFRTYQAISRLDWATPLKDNTQMLPGGGAGMLGAGKTALLALIPLAGPFLAYRYSSKQQGAFQEARNIQGSEAHASLFGQTSVFVSGQEHAALTSAKKVVITANDQVEVHSRGKTEIAGGEAVYLTAAKALEAVSRGEVLIKATGPQDGASADGSIGRYFATVDKDKDRSVFTMKRGESTLLTKDKTGITELCKLQLKVDDATSKGALTIETGTTQSLKLTQGASDAASTITMDTPGSFTLTAAKQIEEKVDPWKLGLGTSYASLGDGTNELSIDSSSATLKTSGAFVELFSSRAAITSTDVTIDADGKATVNGSKILLG